MEVLLGFVLLMFFVGNMGNMTYSLKTAEDFKLFENLPNAQNANFVIENDIDFEGKSYGMGIFKSYNGTIDGQGYTISNIKYVSDDKEHDFAFSLNDTATGVIKNIKIKDSTFVFTKFLSREEVEDDWWAKTYWRYYIPGILIGHPLEYSATAECTIENVTVEIDGETYQGSIGGVRIED